MSEKSGGTQNRLNAPNDAGSAKKQELPADPAREALAPEPSSTYRRIMEVFTVSAKLGLTSFGGPAAHLGYFHHEYVKKRKWLDETSYADLVALCQFLPGPASSQTGIGIGFFRAGFWGGAAAWLGFTLPSAVALAWFASLAGWHDLSGAGWIHGLKLVAVAVVAHAVFSMGKQLAPDRGRATIALATAAGVLVWPAVWSQVACMLLAAAFGLVLYRKAGGNRQPAPQAPIRKRTAVSCLLLFAALLLALPIFRLLADSRWLDMADLFYRTGALVFGGGHVVLPLLERETVAAGLLSAQQFLAGYGAAQAVPGPMFTFASYLGAVMGGAGGAILATAAIFLPGFLLVAGALPFWHKLQNNPRAQGALAGLNAAVVGLLLAALYDPIWTSAVVTPGDFVLALMLYGMLAFWKLPSWTVVAAGAAGGMMLAL
jgi:chromate transporter